MEKIANPDFYSRDLFNFFLVQSRSMISIKNLPNFDLFFLIRPRMKSLIKLKRKKKPLHRSRIKPQLLSVRLTQRAQTTVHRFILDVQRVLSTHRTYIHYYLTSLTIPLTFKTFLLGEQILMIFPFAAHSFVHRGNKKILSIINNNQLNRNRLDFGGNWWINWLNNLTGTRFVNLCERDQICSSFPRAINRFYETEKRLTFWALQAAANGKTSWGWAACRSRRHRPHIAILHKAQYKLTASPLWSLQIGLPSDPRRVFGAIICQLPLGGPRLCVANGPRFGWQDSLQSSQYNTWNHRYDMLKYTRVEGLKVGQTNVLYSRGMIPFRL